MKKTFFYLLITVFSFSVISCNNNENKKTKDSENKQEKVAEEEELSPEELARVTPADIDLSKPIPVAALNKAYFEWEDVEVTIAGYVRMYAKSEPFQEEFDLVEEPGSTDYLFDCTFSETPEGEINADDVIIIKGKIDGSGFSGIRLVDCEYIGVNEEYSDKKDLSPYNMPEKPMFAKYLFDVYNAWKDVEVAVIGHYWGTTTSKLSDRDVWRVDLSDPETGKKMVGCRTKIEPDSDFLSNNRDDVVIRGIVKGEIFGSVLLEECEIK